MTGRPGPGLDGVLAALRAGDPVVVPTDTVYGVAVDPSVPGASARLFVLKGRPPEVALPVLAGAVEQALALLDPGTDAGLVRVLAEAFWPGPLTIVAARREGVAFELGGADDGTIGVRVPDAEVVRALAAEVGPLAVSSANRHGEPTPDELGAVLAALGSGVAASVDGGRCDGVPSTVVRVRDGRLEILRAGAVTADRLAAFVAS